MPPATTRSSRRRSGAGSPSSRTGLDGARDARLRAVRAAIRKADCDSLLITNPDDIRYLTGFSGEDSVALVQSRKVTIVSDFRFAEDLEVVKGRSRVVMRDGRMADALGALTRDEGVERIGVQSEHLTLAERRTYGATIGARRLVPTEGLLSGLRVIKDELEVAQIRKAARLQEQALLATLDDLRPGQREREIAARLEFEMKSRGASGPSFPTIVASGAFSSRPHAVPAGAKTAKNRVLLIDWGARLDGYCADMTRTFALGSWPKAMREVYGIVLEAFEAALATVRAGVSCRAVDAAARSVIADAGYGERFGHGLGHGLGLEVHEAPRLSRQSDDTLRPGMVVTIEPGIYLPGVGGVRIEDDVLVTDSGARNLSTLPRDIDWATR
jgi:Xaa-Pro aminopeptidase